MRTSPYLAVLRTPRVRSISLVVLAARLPTLAASMTITLHVVLGLERGYGAAGLAAGVCAVGTAVGSPLMGRVVDGRGLRVMLLVSTAGGGVFWFSAPLLPYPALLLACFFAGLTMLPVSMLGRQVVTAVVPPALRRTALAMDSMSIELVFMVAPAVAIYLTSRHSSQAAMWTVGVAMLLSGAALYAMNPPIRPEHEGSGAKPPRREWLDRRLTGALVCAGGAAFVISGMEVALIANMTALGLTTWIGLVIVVMCLASLVGGFVYGGLKRVPPLWALMGAMGLLTMPVGLLGGSPWLLAVALIPSSLLCAPTITSASEDVTRLTPAAARGEAMGLQGSAFTLGAMLGAPLAGVIVDHASPAMAYLVAGLGAAVIAAVAARTSAPRTPAAIGGAR
ncbi:MFS transporter [Actinokineospora sp. 24-640]